MTLPFGDGAEERAGLHLAVRLSSAFDCRAGNVKNNDPGLIEPIEA
jgi:hypothetical protein